MSLENTSPENAHNEAVNREAGLLANFVGSAEVV
jgi:hypothetical protein